MPVADRPKVRVSMLSERGLVREGNEDACLASPEHGLFMVSDGMGGHQAGALASRIVVNVLPELIEREFSRGLLSAQHIRSALTRAAAQLSSQLREEAAGHPELAGMGATVVLALLAGRAAHIIHLGDSRAYLVRRGRLHRLTKDHTVASVLLRLKEISPEEARGHPGAHRLSRYVGMEGEPIPDIRTLQPRVGDRLLLCSDGLTSMLSNRRVGYLLRQHVAPDEACQALVAAANAAGGRDNISVVVVDIDAVSQDA